MSFFGAKIAIAYVVLGLVLAVIGGTLIDKLGMKRYVKDFVFGVKSADVKLQSMTRKDRIDFSKSQVKDIINRVWKYILIGVGVGALIHNWIPQPLIESIIGKKNPFAVVLATIVGIPIYADIFGTIPIAEALIGKGVEIGTVLSFMMGVTTLSFPSLVMLSQVVDRKLLGVFLAIVAIGIIVVGYAFNIFSFLFL